MSEQLEQSKVLTRTETKTPEVLKEKGVIAIATTTFYPDWNGDSGYEKTSQKVRGDIALATIEEAKKHGYQLIVVDGGSSQAFKERLSSLGVEFSNQVELGMSSGRQQAFKEAADLKGVQVIVWTEPEELSIIRDCLPEAVVPILTGEADIVIPKREEKSFATYPSYQVEYEKRANRLWNAILRKQGLLPKHSEDLDVWFGPKFFKNSPEILELFLAKYEFKKGERALDSRLKVTGVKVRYVHPKEQTAIELENIAEFSKKRDIQFKDIIVTTIHFIRLLRHDTKSRLIAG